VGNGEDSSLQMSDLPLGRQFSCASYDTVWDEMVPSSFELPQEYLGDKVDSPRLSFSESLQKTPMQLTANKAWTAEPFPVTSQRENLPWPLAETSPDLERASDPAPALSLNYLSASFRVQSEPNPA
jgi:hypothetical protein